MEHVNLNMHLERCFTDFGYAVPHISNTSTLTHVIYITMVLVIFFVCFYYQFLREVYLILIVDFSVSGFSSVKTSAVLEGDSLIKYIQFKLVASSCNSNVLNHSHISFYHVLICMVIWKRGDYKTKVKRSCT